MAEKTGWTRSDFIAGLALLVGAVNAVTQYTQRDAPYKLQLYNDQTQASNKILDALGELINARQVTMIAVERHVYDPRAVRLMPLEALNSDARIAMPVIMAFGAYRNALQNNARFWKNGETLIALQNMDREVEGSVRCFLNLGSARNKVNGRQLEAYRAAIATSCEGANLPPSLVAAKAAERVATAAMDAERAKARE